MGKLETMENLQNRTKIKSQNHSRNDRAGILSILYARWHRIGQILENPILGLFSFYSPWKNGYLGKILVFGSKYWYLDQNMGLWVKSGWYGRSGLVVRSSAHNPKIQVRFPPPPLWDPTSVLVGGAPSGDYFSPKSPFGNEESWISWIELKNDNFR